MNIGLIAHDSKKKLMQNFCIAYRGILCQHSLYATGTTGRLIEEAATKDLVDGAPKMLKEGASKEEAEEIKKKVEEVGAKVTLK